MNKVILMGRLTREPQIQYTKGNTLIVIARYTLAVNRRWKQQGQPEADFVNCVMFGKTAEFAAQYLTKGQQIAVTGRLQVRSWDDENGKKQWSTEVVVEEHYFAESKSKQIQNENTGFYPSEENDDDLPF